MVDDAEGLDFLFGADDEGSGFRLGGLGFGGSLSSFVGSGFGSSSSSGEFSFSSSNSLTLIAKL